MGKPKPPIKIIHRKLGNYKADGLAWTDQRTIEIDSRLTGLRALEVTIHEIMHVQNPKWSEIMVEGKATEMAQILWDMGYRKCDL